jgi:hypothetical protein
LKEQSVEIERKINTAITNLERAQKAQRLVENTELTAELKTDIQTAEDNLKKEIQQNTHILQIHMDTRFKMIQGTMKETKNEILQEADVVLRDYEKRIKRLEQVHHTTS